MFFTPQALVGAAFLTGQKAPVTGVYSFIRHIDDVDKSCCTAIRENCQISLSRGDKFPSHWSCGRRVLWRLSGCS